MPNEELSEIEPLSDWTAGRMYAWISFRLEAVGRGLSKEQAKIEADARLRKWDRAKENEKAWHVTD